MKPGTRRASPFDVKRFRRKCSYNTSVTLVAVITAFLWVGIAHAYKFDAGPNWEVNLDNSVQYTMGWRAQEMNDKIGNHLFFTQGDYKFPDRGDMVTNRIQDLVEFQSVFKGKMGVRVSGSYWKDFAYDNDAEVNPNHPAFAALNSYPSGEYSNYTEQYFCRGGEFLDAFAFFNTEIGGLPSYIKAGRLTQYWGNAFFFGFSNIAYSQHPIDFIKGFTQPGSEVKELFLPRAQVLWTTELTPSLSLSAQCFIEFQPNRYPEGGTYLGFFDILFDGPPGAGALAGYGITQNDGYVEPEDINDNFGVKVAWSPEWANGDLGFFYRQFDEVHPWQALINPASGHLQNPFAEKVKLIGISYERAFGMVSTGFELNTRFNTTLNTHALVPVNEGARGTITNLIANTFIQLGTTPLWDSGILLAEISYTYLNKVTDNAALFNDADQPGNSWKTGGATRNAIAFAMLFTPQWLQVFPSVDFEMPLSLTTGLYGNPAYGAGAFYAQESFIYSIGLRAILKTKHFITLSYNGYHWRPGSTADNGLGAGLPAYAGFGGNGPVSLNDRGWVGLQYKTSF